jgi:2'-5' RNA ligase
VQERHVDDLLERLRRAGARRTPFEVGVAGGGAFPNPRRSKVLYAALEVSDPVELGRLATGVRAAGNKAGADVRGGPFRPHVTLARLKQPVDVTRWLTVLGAYSGPRWQAAEVTLIESHLGEGPRRRPRYEVVDTFPLGATGRRVGS